MGAVEEFEYASTRTSTADQGAAARARLPSRRSSGRSSTTRDRTHLAEAFVPALNHEIRRLAAAGCKWIQLDEPATPGYAANDPHTAGRHRSPVQRLHRGRQRRALSACTSASARSASCRTRRRRTPATSPICSKPRADQFVFEYAHAGDGRDRAVDRRGRLIASSVPGSSTSARTTARRPTMSPRGCGSCLDHVPAEKLFLTTDCGLRYVHRTLARAKITNLVAGVRLVRDQLAGS